MTTHRRLGYFGERFDCESVSAPRHRYAIFSSPRTGSNYLCARLNNASGCLGMPMEYLHADAIDLIGARVFPGATGAIDLRRYLDAVATVRTTRDGWFGVKIQPNQLLPLFEDDVRKAAEFLRSFDRLIFMTRDDKLGQAVSGAIAHATGAWFNFGDEPDLAGTDIARLFPLIARLELQYGREERMMSDIARRLQDRPVLHIVYEDLLENAEKLFRDAAAFLGCSDPALIEEKSTTTPTRKPPGAWADRVKAAYLEFRANSSINTAHD